MFKWFKRGKSLEKLEKEVQSAREGVIENAKRLGTLESTVDDMLNRRITETKK